jgi:Asp-tRNA(Asn)/Glu-tRNA(Gln) amidotransferase A subunit family amidase
MNTVRRQFLHLADAATALFAAPYVVRAQGQAPKIGLNPHYGTPGNPADRTRVPGGSSSGAAVAVTDGMCEIAIGTDTGGSTRIPAEFCGVVGYKPTNRPNAFPLSYTLDSVGPIARSVAACAAADAVMAGDDAWPLGPAPLPAPAQPPAINGPLSQPALRGI